MFFFIKESIKNPKQAIKVKIEARWTQKKPSQEVKVEEVYWQIKIKAGKEEKKIKAQKARWKSQTLIENQSPS